MYNENATAERPPNIEEKLNTILKLVRGEGRSISQSSSRLADKLSGSIPSSETNAKPPKPINDCAHAIIDDITNELASCFTTTTQDLDRAHRSVGEFGRDRLLKEVAEVAYQEQPQCTKGSRY